MKSSDLLERAVDPTRIKPLTEDPRASDKYSRRLYNFIRRHGSHYPRVFSTQGAVLGLDNHMVPFAYEHCASNDIFLGFLDDGLLCGTWLHCVLAGTGTDFKGAYMGLAHRALDITEWFWSEYLVRGRCLFDPDHGDFGLFMDDRYDFSKTGAKVCGTLREVMANHQADTKTCRWCGASYHLESVMVPQFVWRSIQVAV